MRWLIFALLVSTVALLVASAGLAYHIWVVRKQRQTVLVAGKQDEVETEEAHEP